MVDAVPPLARLDRRFRGAAAISLIPELVSVRARVSVRVRVSARVRVRVRVSARVSVRVRGRVARVAPGSL